jgi:adenine-specific DNA-methyltransferase
VPGVIYDEAVHARNKARGLPTNFLRFTSKDRLNAGAKRYVALGETQALHERYKCRIREPWYAVPSVYSTDVGMLKRSHDAPRLVSNRLAAFTTDTAYRIKPKGVKAEQLVWNFSTSLTALSAELNGRHYGGGVLELVPSEIERLLVPTLLRGPGLADLEQLYRDEVPIERLLEHQDRAVLGRIGVPERQQRILRHAWKRLRARRRRELLQMPPVSAP